MYSTMAQFSNNAPLTTSDIGDWDGSGSFATSSLSYRMDRQEDRQITDWFKY